MPAAARHEEYADVDKEIEREAAIRRRVLRDYNKRPEDFATESEYNDYLEAVEDIILNLCTSTNVEETNERIARFRKENAALIRRNHAKRQEEERAAAARAAEEQREHQARLVSMLQADREETERRRREQRAERSRDLDSALAGGGESARANKAQRAACAAERDGGHDERAEQAGVRLRVNMGSARNAGGGGDGVPHLPAYAQQQQRQPMQLPRAVTRSNAARDDDDDDDAVDPRARRMTAARAAGFDPALWRQRALDELRRTLAAA